MEQREFVDVDWGDHNTLSKLAHLARGEAKASSTKYPTVIIEASVKDAFKISRNMYFCTMNGLGMATRWVQIGTMAWGYTRDDLPDLVVLLRCVDEVQVGRVGFRVV